MSAFGDGADARLFVHPALVIDESHGGVLRLTGAATTKLTFMNCSRAPDPRKHILIRANRARTMIRVI